MGRIQVVVSQCYDAQYDVVFPRWAKYNKWISWPRKPSSKQVFQGKDFGALRNYHEIVASVIQTLSAKPKRFKIGKDSASQKSLPS